MGWLGFLLTNAALTSLILGALKQEKVRDPLGRATVQWQHGCAHGYVTTAAGASTCVALYLSTLQAISINVNRIEYEWVRTLLTKSIDLGQSVRQKPACTGHLQRP